MKKLRVFLKMFPGCRMCSLLWFEEEQVPGLFWSQAYNLTAEIDSLCAVELKIRNGLSLKLSIFKAR